MCIRDSVIIADDPLSAVANGTGAVFTFGLKGGYDAGVKLVNEVNLFSHLANIGDAKSACSDWQKASEHKKIVYKMTNLTETLLAAIGLLFVQSLLKELKLSKITSFQRV